jgi:hypothetical protein
MKDRDKLYPGVLLLPQIELLPQIDTQTEAIGGVADCVISTDPALGCWKTAFAARKATVLME